MAALLRAGGREFDVEAFLGGCTLPVSQVHRRGEPVFPASRPGGPRNEASHVNIEVSDAGFGEFDRQVTDAIAFLAVESEQVRRLCGWPGVEGVTLDFGIAWRDVIRKATTCRRNWCGSLARWVSAWRCRTTRSPTSPQTPNHEGLESAKPDLPSEWTSRTRRRKWPPHGPRLSGRWRSTCSGWNIRCRCRIEPHEPDRVMHQTLPEV